MGSAHSRFGVPQAQMTERILPALEDPHLTSLAHSHGPAPPEPGLYAVDLDAVLEASHVLNAHDVDVVTAFARARRNSRAGDES